MKWRAVVRVDEEENVNDFSDFFNRTYQTETEWAFTISIEDGTESYFGGRWWCVEWDDEKD